MLQILKNLLSKKTTPENQLITSLLKPTTLEPLANQLIISINLNNLPNNEQHAAILLSGKISNAITDYANLKHRPVFRIHQTDTTIKDTVTLLLSYQ